MKTLYLIRGVSGSGKSTLAFEMAQAMDIDYVEADAFFYDSKGIYNFDPKLLGANHLKCQGYAKECLESGESVIVSNTSTTEKEVSVYKNIAEKYDAKFVCIVVENRHGNANQHNVPDYALERQRNNLKNSLEL